MTVESAHIYREPIRLPRCGVDCAETAASNDAFNAVCSHQLIATCITIVVVAVLRQ